MSGGVLGSLSRTAKLVVQPWSLGDGSPEMVEAYDPNRTYASTPYLVAAYPEVDVMAGVYKIVVRPRGDNLVVTRLQAGARGGFYVHSYVTLTRDNFAAALRSEPVRAVIDPDSLDPDRL